VSGRSEAAAGATPAAEAAFGADIPTLQESGIDVELANWRGFVAPPEISDEARACMVQSIEQATQSPTWQDTLERFGWVDYFLGGDEFAAFLEEETTRVNELLAELGLV
jgi:putative tricarboxylic transport membrane protein